MFIRDKYVSKKYVIPLEKIDHWKKCFNENSELCKGIDISITKENINEVIVNKI